MKPCLMFTQLIKQASMLTSLKYVRAYKPLYVNVHWQILFEQLIYADTQEPVLNKLSLERFWQRGQSSHNTLIVCVWITVNTFRTPIQFKSHRCTDVYNLQCLYCTSMFYTLFSVADCCHGNSKAAGSLSYSVSV